MLSQAQDRQEAAAPTREPIDFKEGDDVLLSTKHLSLTCTYSNVAEGSKLRHRFAGPFKVLKIRGNAAKLDLPKDLGIEDMQNVDFLKKYHPGGRENPPPPPLRRTKDGDVQEVEKIVEHEWAGTNRRNLKYRVRWLGFGEGDGEWLSVEQLKDSKHVVDDYHAREQGSILYYGASHKKSEGCWQGRGGRKTRGSRELFCMSSDITLYDTLRTIVCFLVSLSTHGTERGYFPIIFTKGGSVGIMGAWQMLAWQKDLCS